MIYRSPYPDVAVPDLSLTDLVLGRARGMGERPALVDGVTGRTLTYGGFVDLVERTAGGLHRWGFRKGDVAAILTPNRPEFAVAFHAVARLGGACTTMNPAFTAREVREQLDDAGARVVFTVPELAERVGEAAGDQVEGVWCFGDPVPERSFDSLAAAGAVAPPVPVDPAEDVVAIPYSSGTTGRPKGVLLTHRNLVATLAELEPLERYRDGDCTVGVLPFFHIYGLVVILNQGLSRGATVITLPRF